MEAAPAALRPKECPCSFCEAAPRVKHRVVPNTWSFIESSSDREMPLRLLFALDLRRATRRRRE